MLKPWSLVALPSLWGHVDIDLREGAMEWGLPLAM
jgi:hypothetical protein